MLYRTFTATTLTMALMIPSGTDIASYAGNPPRPADLTCLGLPVTLAGTDGRDVLVGTPGDDVVAGRDGDDVLRGGGGNDVLCGGRGIDRLSGGPGDDRLSGGRNGLRQSSPDQAPDNIGDRLIGGPGDDLLDPGYDSETDGGGGSIPDQLSYEGVPVGVDVDLAAGTATGDGDDTLVLEGSVLLIGTAYDDVLVGGEFWDDIWGGEGADVLRGGPGRDYLQADPADLPSADDGFWDDRVYGGPGGDGIYVGNGDDVLRGGSGDDTLVHGYGRADLMAGQGNDYLDTLLSFADGQQVDGGPGVDLTYAWAVVSGTRRRLDVSGRINLALGVLTMRLGETGHAARFAGIEQLRIPDGRWHVWGSAADEEFFGGELSRSQVVVRALGGDDRVSGTPGHDVLNGGPGRDRVTSTAGDDSCVGFEVFYAGERC
jgi:Ca2+-binding RTX toxin-like protein